MKKIVIIFVIVLYLFLGVGLLIAKQDNKDIITFVAIKVCGAAFTIISFYIMYTFKELVK